MAVHHTRQMVADAIQGREYLTVRLAEGDTAWHRAMDHGSRTALEGPGLATYGPGPSSGQLMLLGFDPLAGDHDPRCTATSPEGEVCRLLEGDHLTHYWGEPDAPTTPEGTTP